MSWTDVLLRTIIGFAGLYIVARLLGKKLISQMTFFDFVAGITIGTLTGSAILQSSISVFKGITAVALFGVLSLIVGVITISSMFGRKIFNAEPTIIIKNGQILEKGMRKVRLNMDELLMQLRKKNAFYVDQVELALLETDGTVSVLLKPQAMPVTRKDMKINASSRGEAEAFIIDGQLMDSSLQRMKKDEAWVNQVLQEQGISDVSDVAFAQIDNANNIYIDKRTDNVH